VRRVVVLGGLGLFGGAAVERLRADGLDPVILSRRTGIDVENAASLRARLRPEDVVIDAVGPFQDRGLTLLEVALDLGCDIVDISDSLDYAERLLGQRDRIERAGIRVLTGCSSVSAITAAFVQLSGLRTPLRMTAVLAPASRYTAHPGAAGSLLRAVGRPVRLRRDGRLITRIGWTETRTVELPEPLGPARAFLFESADALLLPRVWPSLACVEFFVTTGVLGLDRMLSLAVRWPIVRAFVRSGHRRALPLVRVVGRRVGCLAAEVAGVDGVPVRLAVVARKRGELTAIVPAVLAARAIAEGRFAARGFVDAASHVAPKELLEYLTHIGIEFVSSRSVA
jgi:hypothetical protein